MRIYKSWWPCLLLILSVCVSSGCSCQRMVLANTMPPVRLVHFPTQREGQLVSSGFGQGVLVSTTQLLLSAHQLPQECATEPAREGVLALDRTFHTFQVLNVETEADVALLAIWPPASCNPGEGWFPMELRRGLPDGCQAVLMGFIPPHFGTATSVTADELSRASGKVRRVAGAILRSSRAGNHSARYHFVPQRRTPWVEFAPGLSGAPIIALVDGQSTIVGINSGSRLISEEDLTGHHNATVSAGATVGAVSKDIARFDR